MTAGGGWSSEAIDNRTSPSLLNRVQSHDPEAWQQLVDLYGPLVFYWCCRAGLKSEDASDTMQDVFASVLTAIEGFGWRGSGTFRGWLWTITRNKINDHYRRVAAQGEAQGGSHAQQWLAAIPEQEPDSSVPGADHDEINSLLHRGLELVRANFEDRTWQAFWRVTIEEQSTTHVAEDFGISANAVRQAKSRVLRRLREELGEVPLH